MAVLGVALAVAGCGGSPERNSTARVRLVQEIQGGIGLRGEGVIDFARDALSVTVDGPASKGVESRYFGPTAYHRDQGRWFTNGARPGAPGSAWMTLLHGAGQPGTGLAYLRGLDPSTAEVGRPRVRGARTTHYRGTVATGPIDGTDRTIEVQLWVDNDGRVLRLRLADRQTLTYDFSDFGVAADIDRPVVDERR